jgi:hypothetical protein
MEFKARSATPSQYRSPAKQFFAEHMGIVLTTIIVIICIGIVIRAQFSASEEEETGPTQSALFDPLPDEQQPRGTGMPASRPSSMDARPVWGMALPAEDDGGPIVAKQPENVAQAEKPPPPPVGTGGLAIPNFPLPQLPVEEVKKILPKPSGQQQGSNRSLGGGGTYQPAASAEEQERKKKEEEARRKAAPAAPALGYEAQQAGKPNLTRKRQTIAVDKGVSNAAEELQKTTVQKEIIYTLQHISQQVQQRTLESGTPSSITADDARSLERAIGIMQGIKDKQPSPNANQ